MLYPAIPFQSPLLLLISTTTGIIATKTISTNRTKRIIVSKGPPSMRASKRSKWAMQAKAIDTAIAMVKTQMNRKE
jgi:hypothetical protein